MRALAEKTRIILLTDSDGAGKLIRSYITSVLPKERLINLYTPKIEGKERRKEQASKEGYLGVEGVDIDLLYKLLEPFANGRAESVEREEITKADMYRAGFTGAPDSTSKRDEFAVTLGLPRGMTPNALLAALNVLLTKEKFLSMTNTENEK